MVAEFVDASDGAAKIPAHDFDLREREFESGLRFFRFGIGILCRLGAVGVCACADCAPHMSLPALPLLWLLASPPSSPPLLLCQVSGW